MRKFVKCEGQGGRGGGRAIYPRLLVVWLCRNDRIPARSCGVAEAASPPGRPRLRDFLLRLSLRLPSSPARQSTVRKCPDLTGDRNIFRSLQLTKILSLGETAFHPLASNNTPTLFINSNDHLQSFDYFASRCGQNYSLRK